MADNNQEVEAEGPGGFKIKARGTDVIAIIVLVTGAVAVVLLWIHMQDAKADAASAATVQKETANVIATAIRENTATTRELVVAQRVTNCLFTKDSPTERRSSIAECERIAR